MGLFRRGRRVRSSSQTAALNQDGQQLWRGPLAPSWPAADQYTRGQGSNGHYGGNNGHYSNGRYNGQPIAPPPDCAARVLDGVWPRVLQNPAPEIAQLARYLSDDLQKIVDRTNADLAKLAAATDMSPQERYETEERFIRVAHSMATLRAESTVRQLGGRSLLGSVGTPQLTDRRGPRPAPQDVNETTQVVSPEMIREALAMSRESMARSAEQTGVMPVFRATSPADSETTQVFARHRVPEPAEAPAADATDAPVVITDAVEPMDTSTRPPWHLGGVPRDEPPAPPAGRANVGAQEPIGAPSPLYEDGVPGREEPVNRLRHFNVGDTTEPVSSSHPPGQADLRGGDRWLPPAPADGPSKRYGSQGATPAPGADWTEETPAPRGQPFGAPVPPVNRGDAPAVPARPAPAVGGARLELEQPVTLAQLVGALARQQPALVWLVALRSDDSTVAITDLFSGWIPAGVVLPRGVSVLAPEVRSGAMSEWPGTVRDSARYVPGRRIEGRALGSAGQEAFAVVEVDAGLGERLLEATAEDMSVPQIAHDLVQAVVAGTGVVPGELDVLRVHLETATQGLIDAYPDVNADEAQSCMLMAAAEALASGQDKLAAYHFAWYAAVRR